MDFRVPGFTKANTLPAERAGELMRDSHARLVRARAGIRAWRLAGAVWGLTVPYSKGWEAVFVERLAALTGMDERAVRRGIKECERAGALQWEPNRWIPPRGQPGRPSLIGLPGAPRRVSKRPKTGSSGPGHGPSGPGLGAPKTGSSGPYSLGIEVVMSQPRRASSDTGTHHLSPSLIGASDRSSEDWEAERGAPRLDARPLCPRHGTPLYRLTPDAPLECDACHEENWRASLR